jgi:hypothetical protein
MKNLRLGLLMVMVFANVSSMVANAAGKTNPGDSAVPVEIKFAGLINNQPVFQLSFSGSPLQNDFTIVVIDELGNTLYRERTKGEQFTKNFQLNTDELGDQNLRFEIYCTRTKRSVSYEVNRNSRYVQDIAITKTN